MKRLHVTEPSPGLLRLEFRAQGTREGSFSTFDARWFTGEEGQVLRFIRDNGAEPNAQQLAAIRGALGRAG